MMEVDERSSCAKFFIHSKVISMLQDEIGRRDHFQKSLLFEREGNCCRAVKTNSDDKVLRKRINFCFSDTVSVDTIK